jgi:hypothetical protein
MFSFDETENSRDTMESLGLLAWRHKDSYRSDPVDTVAAKSLDEKEEKQKKGKQKAKVRLYVLCVQSQCSRTESRCPGGKDEPQGTRRR